MGLLLSSSLIRADNTNSILIDQVAGGNNLDLLIEQIGYNNKIFFSIGDGDDNVINLKQRDDLMSYNGDMGNNGVPDLNRHWYNPPQKNEKASLLYRFFYPLTKLNCFASR